MAYPPPPGLNRSPLPSSSSSTPQPHSSLPPRPPPASGPPPSFKPGFSSTPSLSAGAPGTKRPTDGANRPSGYNAFTAFAPRSVASSTFRTHSPTVSAPPAPPTGFSAPATTNYNTTYPQPQLPQQEPSYYNQQQSYGEDTYAAPQIRNPFAPPSQASNNRGRDGILDPEMEAQIAQWQSAYIGKDDSSKSTSYGGPRNTGTGASSATGANTGPLGSASAPTAAPTTTTSGSRPETSTANASSTTANPVTVVRSGGGQTWQDTSLLEWDPAHFRLFVGNLAGEVTDDSLLKAFAKYPSVQKARVIRDKRTTKSKGYGFVSFSDGDEYFKAARDMQGKYIGSHPVLLRRSTTEIRPTASGAGGKNGGKHGKGGGKGGGGGAAGGKTQGGGVQKKPQKTKGGLKVLG